MAKDSKKVVPASRGREDGRRQILLYLKADLITDLKIEAMSREINAYELAEEAIAAYLDKGRRRKR